MPSYDYECICGKTWEVFKSVNDLTRVESCSICGKPGTRLFTAPNVSEFKPVTLYDLKADGSSVVCSSAKEVDIACKIEGVAMHKLRKPGNKQYYT